MIIVALVLVVGRGLVYAGVVELITQKLAKFISGIGSQIAVMGSAAALLSSVINNIAALAILMPSDIQLNKKAKRNPALTLMPLAIISRNCCTIRLNDCWKNSDYFRAFKSKKYCTTRNFSSW